MPDKRCSRCKVPCRETLRSPKRYVPLCRVSACTRQCAAAPTSASGWEQLCRYITRPALANERVQCNSAGQVVLKLKTPWHDGTTHIVMSPLEFMQRLAALVPRPRLHLIRFHGVLAPNAKLRSLVVPAGPQEDAGASEPATTEPGCAHHRPARISWARLLKRVFEIDLEHCPNCGGELKIIAAIVEAPVIERILTHLGLQARAPPRAPAHRRTGTCCTRPDLGLSPPSSGQRLGADGTCCGRRFPRPAMADRSSVFTRR